MELEGLKDEKNRFPKKYLDEDEEEYPGILPCQGRKEGLYPWVDISIWLRTCLEELSVPVQGLREGRIPEWLEGRLIQNGPGKFSFGRDVFNHLFDGSALLQQFTIKNGEATYMCRFVRSKAFLSNLTAGGIAVPEFGTSVRRSKSAFRGLSRSQVMSDNTMITVYPFDGALYTYYESPFMHKIDPQSLATLGKEDMGRRGLVSQAAHPHWDREGNMFTLGLRLSISGPQYTITKFKKGEGGTGRSLPKRGVTVGDIPCTNTFSPSYMHSFAITDHWIVVVEQPLVVSVTAMTAALVTGKPVSSALRWKAADPVVFHLLNRETGKRHPIKYQSSPFFYLHTINAYEEDGHIVIDICCYASPAMLNCMYLEELSKAQGNPQYAKLFYGRPRRFVLPLTCGETNFGADLVRLSYCTASAHQVSDGVVRLEAQVLADAGCETPAINYRRSNGRKYRYFYAISSDVAIRNPGRLVKVDTQTSKVESWSEENCYCSEPVYISEPAETKEDSGLLICSLLWGKPSVNTTAILVLSAKDLSPIARWESATKA